MRNNVRECAAVHTGVHRSAQLLWRQREGAAMKRWTLVRLADGDITHAKGETQRTHTEGET